jgi:hypothetical protein
MTPTHRQEVEAILAGARAEHAALLSRLSPAMRASLPVDATGITQAIDHLGRLGGMSADLHGHQARAHRANPAVLHGRVFGREPLSPGTVRAAFAEGARVRADVLCRLAASVGGPALADEIGALLGEHAPLDAVDDATLRATYAAQERAAVRIAAHLDDAP